MIIPSIKYDLRYYIAHNDIEYLTNEDIANDFMFCYGLYGEELFKEIVKWLDTEI